MTNVNTGDSQKQVPLQQLKLQLQSTNPFDRFNALLQLRTRDPAEIKPILKTIINKDPDRSVCELALLILAEVRDPELLPIAKRLLMDDSEHRLLRGRAVWVVGTLQTKEAYQILLKALQDRSEEVVYWAIMNLQNYQYEPVLPQLFKMLASSRSEMIRRAIIWLLGKVKESTAREILEKALLQDTAATVRMLAAWALHQIGDLASIPNLCKALQKEANELAKREISYGIGKILREQLARKEQTEDFEKTKDIAVRVLNRVLLRDQSYIVRRTSAEALGKLKDKRTVPNLLEVLTTDTNPFVRREIIFALGEIGDPSVEEVLKNAKRSNYKLVADAAHQALLKLRQN